MTDQPIFTGIVDIHHSDGTYDLDDAKRGGIAALWHKATEGVTFKDPDFWTAMDRCAAVGLLRGAYHFASGTTDPVAQADEFLSIVHAIPSHADILLCLDLEGSLDDPKTMTTADAARLVERVREVTGRWPVLYAGSSKTRERARRDPDSLARLAKCPFWQAQYGEMPTDAIGALPLWSLWQYTNGTDGPRDREKFPRVAPGFHRTAQDRSAFRGTVEEFTAWWMNCGR